MFTSAVSRIRSSTILGEILGEQNEPRDSSRPTWPPLQISFNKPRSIYNVSSSVGSSPRRIFTGFFLGDMELCITSSLQLKRAHDAEFLGSRRWKTARILPSPKWARLSRVSLYRTRLSKCLIAFVRTQRLRSGLGSALLASGVFGKFTASE